MPFILAAQNNFQRFNASQRVSLFKKIFLQEFDMDVLMQAEVIQEHFMLHTHQKQQIVPSWSKNRFGLTRSMIGMGNLMEYIEPIMLIADYFGEK